MAFDLHLTNLTGKWSGTSQLWLRPGEDARESNSTAEVGQFAQGQFVAVSYDWEFDGQPQDGLIIFRGTLNNSPTRSVFLDSWHMSNDIMLCEGSSDDSGAVSLLGAYPAPPGPDWGWRIEIESVDRASMVIRMLNITPDGDEALAVLSQYRRPVDDA